MRDTMSIYKTRTRWSQGVTDQTPQQPKIHLLRMLNRHRFKYTEHKVINESPIQEMITPQTTQIGLNITLIYCIKTTNNYFYALFIIVIRDAV